MPIPPGIEMRSSPEQVLSVLGSVLRDGEGTEKFSNFLEIESVRKVRPFKVSPCHEARNFLAVDFEDYFEICNNFLPGKKEHH